MFEKNTLWAYPTDTSFGLGARCDDPAMLEKLTAIKFRAPNKFYSLMMRDFAMLQHYAHVPQEVNKSWFFESPKTILLPPKNTLPKSKYWPEEKVAFRVCTLPEIAQHIEVPVTATSANISGKEPLFRVEDLSDLFGTDIYIYDTKKELPKAAPSQIWDATTTPWKRIR